ncbi:MAG: calcium/sodium antiporter [Anaerovoracaceae bacterium]
METFLMYLLFAIGIVLIVRGGDWFVDGAAWLAEVTGIPKFIVGATIISIATTLPEIIVSSMAAMEGHKILISGIGNYIVESQEKVGMAIGNGIGSVICNTALVMAISLIFLPIKIERKDFVPKALLLICSVMALFLLSLNGALTVSGAVVLLVILAVYIFENIKSARNNISNCDEEPVKADRRSVARHLMLIVVGAACIVLGSRLLVDNGGEIARNWGVSEAIIGVTIVAIGTSLPELVTAVAAVVKRHPSMSIGNVIGANIIDTTLILSVCSFIYGGNLPVSVQNIHLDFPVAILVSLIAVVPTIIQKKFSRWQGIVMVVIYIAYLIMVTTEPEWIFGY